MPDEEAIAAKLELLRSTLERRGAPAWQPSRPTPVPDLIADLCPPGSQRQAWVSYVASIDLGWDARRHVAFGWTLLNVPEIAARLTGGRHYGADLEFDGVVEAWKPDWLPVLDHNDGVMVVDGSDAVHRLFWEAGARPIATDLAGLIDLLVSLVEDGTYIWLPEHQAFDLGNSAGHPLLDAF